MFVQQCNVSLIQVVLSLSLGNVGDFEGLAVCEDDALAGFEGFARGNLDGFYSCDMIGLVHVCAPKPSSYSWAVSLFICRALHPGESSLSRAAPQVQGLWNLRRTTGVVKRKRALAWEVHGKRPFVLREYPVLRLV
jgi:hypothetical protein